MLDINGGGLKPYKFEYIRDMIINNIACGNLKAHAKLPSINNVCATYNMSQVTVRRAFMHLRKRGYIAHFPGKGYFVEDTLGLQTGKKCRKPAIRGAIDHIKKRNNLSQSSC